MARVVVVSLGPISDDIIGRIRRTVGPGHSVALIQSESLTASSRVFRRAAAAVLILNPSQQELGVAMVSQLVEREMTRLDFRVYVISELEDTTVPQRLLDSIQRPSGSIAQSQRILEELRTYVESRAAIRRHVFLRQTTRALLRLAYLVHCLWRTAPYLVLAACLWLGYRQSFSALFEGKGWWTPWFLLLLGTYAWPFALRYLALSGRSGDLIDSDRRFPVVPFDEIWPAPLVAFVGPAAWTDAWPMWIAGVGYGLLLDGLARAAAQQEPGEVADGPAWTGGFLADSVAFRAPLVGKPPSVFVSYTVTSEWSLREARSLHRELDQRQIECFVAELDTLPGVGWRHKIEDRLNASSVVICFIDEGYLSRSWPMAELNQAAASQLRRGSPFVVLVIHEALWRRTVPSLAHGLKKLIEHPFSPDPDLCRVIRCRKETTARLAASLLDYTAPGLLPIHIGGRLLSAIGMPRAILRVVGELMAVPGNVPTIVLLFAWAFLLVNRNVPVGLASWLVAIPTAFYFGYLGRLTMMSVFQLRKRNVWWLVRDVLELGSLTALTLTAVVVGPVQVLVFAPIVFSLGWLSASDTVKHIFDKEDYIERPRT